MGKRRVREGDFVLKLARSLVKSLRHYCKRVKIVGSIRRKEENPVDVDIVLIPKDVDRLEKFMGKKGKFVQGGEKESTWKVEGVKVELYYTVAEEWGAGLLAYSSEAGAGIGLRVVAKKKGFKLNQHGLWKEGKRVAGRTEREIYGVLGRGWKSPDRR